MRVDFFPAAPNTGIVFQRCDLNPPLRIRALVQNRINAPRRTTLTEHGAAVEMVEHVMSALAGLRIDNCEIRVDAAEMPGCDGSSRPYTDALLAAGIVAQGWPRRQLVIDEVCRVGDDHTWVEARPWYDAGLSVRCRIDYGPGTAIGEQSIALQLTPHTYLRELADSRTFLLLQEAEWLRSQGLGERTGYGDLLVFDEHGPIQNTLRYPDECVRHKALDLVGDLALAGCDLVGLIVANCSGHLLNAQLVTALLANYEQMPAHRKSA